LFILEVVSVSFFPQFNMLFLMVVKVYLYSGLLGSMVEQVGGEYPYLTRFRFQKNVEAFWVVVLAVTVMQFSISFIPSIFIPKLDPNYPRVLIAASQIIISYWLAGWMISKKYRLMGSKDDILRRPLLSRRDVAIILILYFLDIFLYYWLSSVNFLDYRWPFVISLVSKFVYFAEFIYLSFLILKKYPHLKSCLNHPKEIYLVNPSFCGVSKSLSSFIIRIYPPVFMILKALTSSKYSFVEFNRKIWQERYYRSDKLVAITCFSSNCYEAYAIAKEFKRRGSTVIMGGPHVTYLPDEALNFCDSVIIGEVEGIWHEVIEDYETGCLKPKYMGRSEVSAYAVIQRKLLQSPVEMVKDFIEATRGCKFRCEFCVIPIISNGRVRRQSIEDIVALVKKVRGKHKFITFLDNNLYNDPAFSRELFTALKPLKIKWCGFSSIDIGKNEETLRLAKESGCFMLAIGYELVRGVSESQEKGKFSMVGRYVQYSKAIMKHGIHIRANFIIGWEFDRLTSFLKFWRFTWSIRPLMAVMSILTPLPGTKFFQKIMSEDRLTNLNWRQYDTLSLVFKHNYLPNAVMSRLYPFVSMLFFLTSSVLGLWLLIGSLICWNILT